MLLRVIVGDRELVRVARNPSETYSRLSVVLVRTSD
jgi:hypothetical protein